MKNSKGPFGGSNNSVVLDSGAKNFDFGFPDIEHSQKEKAVMNAKKQKKHQLTRQNKKQFGFKDHRTDFD